MPFAPLKDTFFPGDTHRREVSKMAANDDGWKEFVSETDKIVVEALAHLCNGLTDFKNEWMDFSSRRLLEQSFLKQPQKKDKRIQRPLLQFSAIFKLGVHNTSERSK